MDQTVPFLRQFLGKYKHILLILLLGIVLMLLPAGNLSAHTEQPESTQPPREAECLQDQLAQLLSSMAGAGNVQVLLTEASGEHIHYQQNADLSENGDATSQRMDTVILAGADRGEMGLVAQVDPPKYLGAVVLCQGADAPGVRLAITEAISNATGLGYHQITVLKMK